MKRSRLRPISDKRRAEREAERDMRMALAARDGHACAAERLLDGHVCGGRLDPHHLGWGAARGARADLDDVVQLCRVAHDWVHAHPLAAREIGLLS